MDTTSYRYVGYANGASRWSPNPTSVVWVIYSPPYELIHIVRMCVGISTNNHDKYDGVTSLLTISLHLGIRHLDVFLDSSLLVSQLNNCYRVCDPCLFRKFLYTRNLFRHFKSFTFMHVPRILNGVADQMANDVLEWHINHRI